MGEVVRFPTRLRPIHPITVERVEIRDALILTMGTCPDCGNSGWKLRPKNLRLEYFDDFERSRCGCGAPDCLDEPDFDGAA
jgi:hypothetical protein